MCPKKHPVVVVFLRWLLALGILVLVEYGGEYLFFGRVNQSPLSLETIEGTGQAYHPSVLFFENPWNGYRYWMAETPYPMDTPPYRDRWECPSIHVSHDGIHWRQPEGLVNPIDDLSSSEIQNRDFFSDPHLVFKDGNLECFYRFSEHTDDGYHTSLVKKTSADGVSWQDRTLLLDYLDSGCLSTVGDMVRSTAILWQNDRYVMWFVDNADPKGDKHVCYSESTDGRHWSKKDICELRGHTVMPWHLDLNYVDGEYLLTLYDFQDLTLWKSSDGKGFDFVKTLLSPSGVYGNFYSDGLYRSSLIKDHDGYKVYFSAYDDRQTRIGLMAGESLEDLRVYSAAGPQIKIWDFPKPFLMIWKVRLWRLKQTALKILSSAS